MQKNHLWQGARLSDDELQEYLDNIARFTTPILGKTFPLEYLLDTMQRFHQALVEHGELYEKFVDKAMLIHNTSRKKAEEMLGAIISFIARDNLRKKLSRELGTITPFAIQRPLMKADSFEGWLPLGILVHIAPTNVFTVPVMCVLEGLLSGNINILKTSAGQHQLPQLFFEELLAFDDRSLLAPYIILLEVSSRKRKMLQQIINAADVVSAWGSEEAIHSIREMTPRGVRFVEWGHKISFAYFSRESLTDTGAIEKVCEDICLLDQNACSSPQDIFVETDDFSVVEQFADQFAEILDSVSKQMPGEVPTPEAQAEISTVVSIARTEEALGLTRVIRAEDFSWSIIADSRKGLAISPLFRTVLIKPLPQQEIVSTLYPMKSYLQTVALVAPQERIIPLSREFFGAGCLRIRKAGHMHDGYVGEPHDGIYALPSFMKRVSLVLDEQMEGIADCRQFEKPYRPDPGDAPVMDKRNFQAGKVDPNFADLTFKSGGSSGTTTYSCFTYEDYHIHMKAAASGLYAAGLEPKTDRVINLFAAGHLYGGFLSFFTILEDLQVPQYPMGIEEDPEVVGQLIVEQKINTILTLPTLAMSLFEANETLFRQHKVIKKIFFGGDHFPEEQIAYLREHFGVELIRAAAYGSNDAGVLGYQCPCCAANEYHLLSELQLLEVFGLDQDRPLKPGETGRLVFTSRHRQGQQIVRYDLGDTGFMHDTACACGRLDPKFSLLGRSSDAFKAGGPFLNYNRFRSYLKDLFGYSGLVQILLSNQGKKQKMVLRVDPGIGTNTGEVMSRLMQAYEELHISVEELGIVFEISVAEPEQFEIVAHSGKVRHLVDTRSEA